MRGGELGVSVFVRDHRIDRGENRFCAVDAAKNSRVLNFAPDHEGWPLINGE
jgi:hypothetical protein